MSILKKYLLFFILPSFMVAALFSFSNKKYTWLQKEFNPDAGLVLSLTKKATVSASSNTKDAVNVLDGDLSTAWVSEAPLPNGFIKNSNQNIFYGLVPEIPHGGDQNLAGLTDGNLDNFATIPFYDQQAKAKFPIKTNHFFSLSVKCQTTVNIDFYIELLTGEILHLGTYKSTDNFQLLRFEKPLQNAKALILSAPSSFEIFEIAALATPPKESIIFHFGQPEKIGVFKGKCWAGTGAAIATHLYASMDGEIWEPITSFPPDSPHELLIDFPERKASFLKIEHTLVPKDWNKVFCWEIKLYDKYGPFGKRPIANQGAVSLRQMLGVNGYWSWGTDQYSFLLGEKEGPRRYADFMSHARNYHDMTWDLNDPDQGIDFSKMKNSGTPAKEWVNWDTEYANWKKSGLDVQASLQFYRFDPSEWGTPEQSAYQYAHAFANHFGQKNGNGLVCTIEAGNEPWKYPSDVYLKILKGVINGAKDADPGIEVLPCALQAADPEMEKTDVFKNYIGSRIDAVSAQQLDGVNTHVYSYVTGQDGKRRGVHPEHPMSSFWEINNLIRWRDHNMPGKKIYLSEWGWDCNGGGEDCTHNECVTEEAAAAYAARGLLISARLGIERASWYYYANEKVPSSLYTRSGLTSSFNAGFQHKKPFNSLQALIGWAGNAYFLKIIREDETAWLYMFGDQANRPTHLVGWLPIDGNSLTTKVIQWPTSLKIESALVLDGKENGGTPIPMPIKTNGGYLLELTPYPIVFTIEQ